MLDFKYTLDLDIDFLQQISKSQAGQDLFVIAMTKGKKNGSYLEIGAGHPIAGSNTFLLEKNFDYSGVSIDKYNEANQLLWKNATVPLYKDVRPKSNFIVEDARNIDYKTLDSYYDYLSFDLDAPNVSWEVIQKIVSCIEFSVITFEHDVWTEDTKAHELKVKTFNLLHRKGYKLLVDNVTIEPGRGIGLKNKPIFFEDWYVNPKFIDKSVMDAYKWVTYDCNTVKYYDKILFKSPL